MCGGLELVGVCGLIASEIVLIVLVICIMVVVCIWLVCVYLLFY